MELVCSNFNINDYIYSCLVVVTPPKPVNSEAFTLYDEDIIKQILTDDDLLNSKIYNQPLSTLKRNGKKINYFYFISSLRNEECNKALKRIVPKINLEYINSIIDGMPVTDLQKQFYKIILKSRKEKILDYSYNKLLSTRTEKMNIGL